MSRTIRINGNGAPAKPAPRPQRRLPSVNGGRAFEAAARLGDFDAAEVELDVSANTVSRLVRLLDRLAALTAEIVAGVPPRHP